MATADELLAGSTGEVEKVLTIDWESRTIDIPKSITNLGVEYDDDTKHLTFRAPKYYHGTDLTKFRVAVGYWNADDEPDVYYPEEVASDDSTMTFTWVVGPHAYTKAGNVEFLVYMLTTNAEGATEKRVGTTGHILPVLKGGNPDQAFVEQHYDAITSAVMEALERAQSTDLKGEPGYTPVKGVDYYTPEEEEALTQKVIQNANGEFANALKGTVSGEAIRVDDVSPIEHTVKAKVGGKNLVNVEDVTLEEFTGYHNSIALGFEVVAGQTYTLSMDVECSVEPFIASIGYGSALTYYVDALYVRYLTNGRIALTFTPTEEQLGRGSYVHVRVPRYATETTYSVTISDIQLELGSTATEYEPYIDPASVTVTACGKNVLPYPFTDKTVTRKGVTFTDNGDGTLTLNGTAEATTSFVLFNGEMPVNGVYTLSGLTGGSGSTYYIQPVCSDKAHAGLTDGCKTYNWYGLTLNRLQLSVVVGTTFSNVKLKPVLELGEVATAYEPYIAAEYTPASNGSVDIVSVSPTMTLMTDTPGVTIEAEYSKDINKQTFGGGSGAVTDGIAIKDRTTGQTYTLYVSNGKLMME